MSRQYWSGKVISKLEENEVFVFGANPQARHFAGAAKSALGFGAIPLNLKQNKPGIARGLSTNNKTYALITKNLTAGVVENGITYHKEGFQSVSPEQIRTNIAELYSCARQYPYKQFLISYTFETWPKGTPKKSLNGYTSQEILDMFILDQDIPSNIVFHDSYQPHIESLNQVKNRVLNVLPNLIVISPREKAPDGFTVINTTSKDTSNIGKQFSPFFLSNIPLYENQVARNMENAWQFSKVYREFANDQEEPTVAYFLWAKKGWADSFAHRYANGKGNIPLYSFWKTLDKDTGLWQEHKWDYITARKNIYFPLYAKAIINTNAFKSLHARVLQGEKIALWDFDGYDHAARNMTYEEVVNEPKYKCGHAFVLYGLLTGQLKVIDNELVYDFDCKLSNKNNEFSALSYDNLQSILSPLYPSKFKYKDYVFCSNEQFIIFSKAKQFKDETMAQKIIDINHEPLIEKFLHDSISATDIVHNKELALQWHSLMSQIKNYGHMVENYDENLWSQRKNKTALFGAKEKFSQNEDLKQILDTMDITSHRASPDIKSMAQYLKEYFQSTDTKNNKPKM